MTGLLDGLATLTPVRLSGLSAGPDAMGISVVFPGGDTESILSKSIGTQTPQNLVRKSTGFRDRCFRRVLTVAPDICTGHTPSASCGVMKPGMPFMVPILSSIRSAGIGHNIALGSQAKSARAKRQR